MTPKTMRALTVPSKYTFSNPAKWSDLVLEEEFTTPVPNAAQYLIRVHAVGISRYELTWQGTYTSTKPRIPSFDVAGVVVSSPSSGKFQPGDRVFGLLPWDGQGGLAEYVVSEEQYLAHMPESKDDTNYRRFPFESAACLPRAALTAWQAFKIELGGVVKPGMNMLVTGAKGAVGRLAVQIARDLVGPQNSDKGAKVIAAGRGTCEVNDTDLPADSYVSLDVPSTSKDWAQEVKNIGEVDIIFDNIGGQLLEESLRLVKDGGWLITVATPIPKWDNVQGIEDARKRGVKEHFFIVQENGGQLEGIAKMVQHGTLKPQIGHLTDGLTEKSVLDIGEQFAKPNPGSNGTVVVQVYRPPSISEQS